MKTLIVTRHAHRDVIDRHADNGLNDRGQKQAIALTDFFLKTYPGQVDVVLSSPRVRCQETLSPLAERLGIPIHVTPMLDEGGAQREDITSRVSQFMEWMNNESPDFTVICSHGDWIPLFFFKAIGYEIELKKSGLLEVSWSKNSKKIVGIAHAF